MFEIMLSKKSKNPKIPIKNPMCLSPRKFDLKITTIDKTLNYYS